MGTFLLGFEATVGQEPPEALGVTAVGKRTGAVADGIEVLQVRTLAGLVSIPSPSGGGATAA